MILQRPQALYLLLCALLAAASVWWGFSPRLLAAGSPAEYLIWAGAGLAFLAIFLFKRLKWQVFLTRAVLFLDAIIFVLLVFCALNLPGGASTPEKGIDVAGFLLLFASMVAALLASYAVKKDLRIVKSADRWR